MVVAVAAEMELMHLQARSKSSQQKSLRFLLKLFILLFVWDTLLLSPCLQALAHLPSFPQLPEWWCENSDFQDNSLYTYKISIVKFKSTGTAVSEQAEQKACTGA